MTDALVQRRKVGPLQLFVEGTDDGAAIRAVVGGREVWDDEARSLPGVHDAGSAKEAFDAFARALRNQNFTRIGVVVDADDTPLGRFERFAQILRETKWPGMVPASLDPDGVVEQAEGRRVGLWVMPDNASLGALEEFLAGLIPADDACWPFADDATRHAREVHGAPLAAIHHAKGRMRTWLAWRKEPGKPYGTAVTAGYLRADFEPAERFKRWITRLFA